VALPEVTFGLGLPASTSKDPLHKSVVASKGNKNLIVIVCAFDDEVITVAASTAQQNKVPIQNTGKACLIGFLTFAL